MRTEQLADANTTLTNQARELEAMNDRLRENDLYKSHFFTMMSHELRTPITAIRAYVDILDDIDETDDAARCNAVNAIRSNAQALTLTIFSTRRASRPERSRLKWTSSTPTTS